MLYTTRTSDSDCVDDEAIVRQVSMQREFDHEIQTQHPTDPSVPSQDEQPQSSL